jgi:molecular chaperone GrpE
LQLDMSENNKRSGESAHDDSIQGAVDQEPLQADLEGLSGQDQPGHSRAQGHPDDQDTSQQEQEKGAADASDELGRLRDALLRTRAEMDNLHKRAERELEKSRKFAVESLLKDLVPIIDSLDQGIEAGDGSGVEGLTLTRKLALDTLKRYGLEVVDPEGEAFDPQWHEAMSMIDSGDHSSGQVISVLQRGYRLHDRVVRAARVVVAK